MAATMSATSCLQTQVAEISLVYYKTAEKSARDANDPNFTPYQILLNPFKIYNSRNIFYIFPLQK